MVKLLTKNYFPSVSWRWLGAGHYAHNQTLLLIKQLLEYGLFTYDEIEELLKDLYRLSEILINLELNCVNDVKGNRVKGAFKIKLFKILVETRSLMAAIMVQIIILLNDYAAKMDILML